MKKQLVHCVFALFLGARLAASSSAGLPTYWIVRPPATLKHHGRQHGYHPGHPRLMPATGYAYGWFGVPPRQHKLKTHGWRENYTQWKYR